MSKDDAYDINWPALAVEWGEGKLAGWHRELEGQPVPSHARQAELNKDIEYMGGMLNRIKKGMAQRA